MDSFMDSFKGRLYTYTNTYTSACTLYIYIYVELLTRGTVSQVLFSHDLVNAVIWAPQGSDMSVDVAVANDGHHGSRSFTPHFMAM